MYVDCKLSKYVLRIALPLKGLEAKAIFRFCNLFIFSLGMGTTDNNQRQP